MTPGRIFLAGWASHRTRGHWGAGMKLSIMAFTPRWAPSEGGVWALAPSSAQELADLRTLVDARRGGQRVDGVLARYRASLEARWDRLLHEGRLAPDELMFRLPSWQNSPVLGDATLCCACSVAEAQAGRCHRAWAGPYLRRAGWQVVLDGRPLD